MSKKPAQCTPEQEAAETFVAGLREDWSTEDESRLKSRLGRDAGLADAFRRVEQSWSSLGAHAESAELMRYREEALAYARQTTGRRWLRPGPFVRARNRAALAAGFAILALAGLWQLGRTGWRPEEYHTGLGEQRTIELADHSRIAIDSATRISVRFTSDARLIELKEGQAQFTVAHDLTRPFKVKAGEQTIVALGTVFTVEYVDGRVSVAMMEGRVAVVGSPAHPASPESLEAKRAAVPHHGDQAAREDGRPGRSSTAAPAGPLELAAGNGAIELSAGEELKVSGHGGDAVVLPNADLEAATAWRSGKLIFRSETLDAAVRQVNRYSRRQIAIADASLGTREISGVFDAGDSEGFVSALQEYLPIAVEYGDTIIELKSK
jgi:transmembrane sensor